ncbi:MAG TPA: Txe/YoeB family addiction module toxin [Candidatus Megaira endosymbiont of Nemacystus decipiens]|nr:Txe/YoeB family addiction module toxin [Candidatus Megaera endosymbiont of Nemacystus decipiens]
MGIYFHKNAFEDYLFFQKNDRKNLERINKLLKDIAREPFSGIGKPEALKHNLSGFWSRRISNEHRLVYTLKDRGIYILQCRYHY